MVDFFDFFTQHKLYSFNIFLTYFNDNVDSVKPIAGTSELKNMLE